MVLKIKLFSSFFDIVSELLRFNVFENWRSLTLFLGISSIYGEGRG